LLKQHKNQVVKRTTQKVKLFYVQQNSQIYSIILLKQHKSQSIQSTCSNNTKDKSLNDQHKSPFNQFAQTQKSSRLTNNTKSYAYHNRFALLITIALLCSSQSHCSAHHNSFALLITIDSLCSSQSFHSAHHNRFALLITIALLY
jgi:hypothetical protein